MEDILLSICISSYNRGEKCVTLVRDILAIEDKRINIFICDDCSERENYHELLSLQSARVTVVRNERNVGACMNWYQTINCGDGRYILHVLDRDDISIEYLTDLLNILEDHPVAGGYIGRSAITLTHTISGNANYEVLTGGRKAFVTMAGVPIHPTGFLVNRESWLKGNYRRFFYDQQKYGIYPHSYVLGELAARFDMLYMPVNFWKSIYRGCNRHSHFYEKFSKKEYWWYPDNVIKVANCQILYLYPLADMPYKEEFLCRRLREGIYRSTIGYRNVATNRAEMRRYGLETCKVSKGKLLLILLKYRFVFSHILKKIDKGKKSCRCSFIPIWIQGVNDILQIVEDE